MGTKSGNASRTKRVAAVAGLGSLALVLAGAAVSWACTAAPYLSASPTQGPPGTSVTLSGNNFSSGPIDFRWGGAGGLALGRANGPGFAVRVKVPSNAAPDVYYITAVQDGRSRAAAAFEVTGTSAPATRPNTGTSGSGGGPSSGQAPGGNGGSSSAGGAAAGVAGGPGRSSVPQRSGRGAPAATAAASPVASARPVVTASGQPAQLAQPGAQEQAPLPASPSPRTISDDVWGSFASGLTFSNREPTLGGGGTGGNNGATVAAGLVALGTMATLGGLAVAGVNRRRQATSSAHQPAATS